MNYAYGPELHLIARIAVDHLCGRERTSEEYKRWSGIFNPGSELCGAAIRADAYGYAFPGRPDLAAYYAYIDASFTHRRTGVYAAMFIAAAISLMFEAKDPVSPFEDALKFVPQRSRFRQNASVCLSIVKSSTSFEDAYDKIHHRFIDYDHCKVYQEVGTLINTLAHAADVWDGVCRQVMQGNDTDSFGCTAGSLLGAYFGYDGLPMERIKIFNDEIHVALASFYEHSLSALARRFGRLPLKFAEGL
jgi:ADP-ribosylglycohydrolase